MGGAKQWRWLGAAPPRAGGSPQRDPTGGETRGRPWLSLAWEEEEMGREEDKASGAVRAHERGWAAVN